MTRPDLAPDHVAIAVPHLEPAAERWRDQLGGGLVNEWDNGTFAGRQYRYPNGGKLEMIAPSPADEEGRSFVRRFLDRFGTQVHHVTLLTDDIEAMLAEVRHAGLDVVDVRLDREDWKEGFLRPSQVGGLVIQFAQTPRTVEEWAVERGVPLTEPAPGAADLLGPTLRHPDLDVATDLWRLLGGEVGGIADGLLVAWEASPLTVRIVEGEPAGPVGLRVARHPDLPHDDALGPPVEGTG